MRFYLMVIRWWLRRETKGWRVFVIAIAFVAVDWLYGIPVFIVTYYVDTYYLQIHSPCACQDGSLVREIMQDTSPFLAPCIFLFFAIVEEVLFRLPLLILTRVRRNLREVLWFAVLLSTLFALTHGNAFHLLLQGVGGFLSCILFLKCGGLQGKWRKPLLVTTLAHAAHNYVIGLLAT